MEHIERVQRELKYKGAILSMYADTIKVPNGNTAVWDFIGHQGAAAVVPVTDDGKILMVRQYRNSVDRYTLEIPAGRINSNDEPGRLSSCKRTGRRNRICFRAFRTTDFNCYGNCLL